MGPVAHGDDTVDDASVVAEQNSAESAEGCHGDASKLVLQEM